MTEFLQAESDGRVFVLARPVNLPAGAKVEIQVRTSAGRLPAAPKPMTDDQRAIWDEIQRDLAASPPPHATLEEAMRDIRGRP
jgi:predicted DNA-binding antitoxin AbrB/MazE fold protein